MKVALTGGIASGKSAVAKMLADLGAVIIDTDQIAREVVAPGTTGLAEVIARFGNVCQENGSLDRAKLADIIFTDPQARYDLESILHPKILLKAKKIEKDYPTSAIIVHVVPLLVEVGWQDAFNEIIVVDVEARIQLARLVNRDCLSFTQAMARIRSQVNREVRLKFATKIIDNSGSIKDTRYQVDQLWQFLVANSKNN